MNQCKDCAYREIQIDDGTFKCMRPGKASHGWVWPDGTCPDWKAKPDPWVQVARKAADEWRMGKAGTATLETAVANALKAKFVKRDWGAVWDRLVGKAGWTSSAAVRSEFVKVMRREVDDES